MKTVRVFLVVLFVLAGTLTSCDLLSPPSVDNGNTSPQPNYSESCSDMPERAELENAEASAFEIELACRIKNHPEQMRPTMSYHPLLGEVARMRAEDMAEYGFYRKPAHVDRHGYGPNYYVCLSGYQADFCPVGEHIQTNTVEIITAGSGERRSSPEKALTGWLNSPGHREAVLLPETEIYFGAGHAYTNSGPDYGDVPAHYWVLLTADPPLDEEMN